MSKVSGGRASRKGRTEKRGTRAASLASRSDFPLLAGSPALHYLDSAATAQKPRAVLDAMRAYYEHDYANPHRGAYTISVRSTERYHEARERVATFFGVADKRCSAGGKWDFKLGSPAFLCDYENTRGHIHMSMKGQLDAPAP